MEPGGLQTGVGETSVHCNRIWSLGGPLLPLRLGAKPCAHAAREASESPVQGLSLLPGEWQGLVSVATGGGQEQAALLRPDSYKQE